MSFVERRYTSVTEFGDGSDGAGDYAAANLTAAKAEYNFTSLEIGNGRYIQAPNWWTDAIPIVTIRCQTAIDLSAGGVIRANACTGHGSYGGGMLSTAGSPSGGNNVVATLVREGSVAATSHPSPLMYPIPGGNASLGGLTPPIWNVFSGNYTFPVGFSSGFIAAGADGDANWGGNGVTREQLIGPGRPFRYCVGNGGGGDADETQEGGAGGGILRLFAPSIIFGTAGQIQAQGSDGAQAYGGSGGGGGGHVEVWTRTALTDFELDGTGPDGGGTAGLHVEGGLGNGSSGDGMDGYAFNIIVQG